MNMKNEEIKRHVRKRYAEVARRSDEGINLSCAGESSACCTSSCCENTESDYSQSIGYTEEEVSGLPDSVLNACAGCGNPTAIAELKEGEVVLDLGSGGGIDVFLAAKKVSTTGKAIGVDMTEEMIELALKNAKKVGHENIDFRLGEIENLPVEDESVDVIISNCVINLSPDQDKVFSEAYRVLKPGGRLMLSDIVLEDELPQDIREDPDAWADCIAGAIDEKVYLDKIRTKGFIDVQLRSKKPYEPAEGYANSIQVEAHKPNI
jgi:SAM-dependent methyltransferase